MSERRRAMAIRRQFRHLSPLIIAWALGALVLLGVGVQDSASVEELFLDPAHLTGTPWYTGLIANLGVLAWTVAVVSAAFGAWVSLKAGRATAVTFLASGALVTALLLMDDLLQLHAVILPSTGMAKTAAQLMVVAPTPLWAWMHRAEISRTRWLLLLAAFGGFGLSLMADQLGGSGSTRLFIEDGAKLLGIFAWAQYFLWTTRDITGSIVDAAMGHTDRVWGIEEPVTTS